MHTITIFGLMIVCLFFVFISIHNIDNAVNMLVIEKETGIKFFDNNLLFKNMDSITMYLYSVSILIIAVILLPVLAYAYGRLSFTSFHHGKTHSNNNRNKKKTIYNKWYIDYKKQSKKNCP